MVFKIGAQFQQLMHCKFRENIVRTLFIPFLETGNEGRTRTVFLIVNKFGKVGLYHSDSLILLHTFLLDLSIPMLAEKSKIPGYPKVLPKCQNTHLVVDAVYAEDCKVVMYLTTKGIIQVYDIGEIETEQPYALDLIPRKEFRNDLKVGKSPAMELVKNKGHVETHRIFGFPIFPKCMEYYPRNPNTREELESFLLIGSSDGCVGIISIRNPKVPFRKRKIRGMMHKIKVDELIGSGTFEIYKAHSGPVTALQFLPDRKVAISTSLDKKYSLVAKDLTESVEPYIASIPKGINALAHSDNLKLIVTGGDDCILRFFNSLVPTLPVSEVEGHKCPIVALEFLTIPFANQPILLSFSKDLELIAWNPTSYHCLQRMYITFPPRSMTHLCKMPGSGNGTRGG